jgi:signal transduction histidine kinase
LWGVLAVVSREKPLPADAERRLAGFAELVATAVANAESSAERARLAAEQAALRRVATLVAEGSAPNEVFAAVRDEAAEMLGVPLTILLRYDDCEATVLATSATEAFGPVGTRWPLEGKGVSVLVHRTGKAARIDATKASGASRSADVRWTVGVPIEVEGRLWGVMAAGSREVEPLPLNAEVRLAKFTQLLATAIANAENRAEFDASRAGIITTTDATRRRIERDLHDGAQQQLVSLALQLRAVQATVPEEFEQHRSELSRVVDGLVGVLDDLREIALGIHPAALSEGGLIPALNTLARRSLIPVEVDIRLNARLPDTIEVTAYYVVSEALTNAAKHARLARGGRGGGGRRRASDQRPRRRRPRQRRSTWRVGAGRPQGPRRSNSRHDAFDEPSGRRDASKRHGAARRRSALDQRSWRRRTSTAPPVSPPYVRP